MSRIISSIFILFFISSLLCCTKHESSPSYDIYITGSIIDHNGTQACYWKNGQLVILTDGTNEAQAIALAKSGSDVYVVGYEYTTTPGGTTGNTVAKYWKNGVAVNLTDGKQSAGANSIAIAGDDIYIAGDEVSSNGIPNHVAKYWKNGVAVNLSDGNNDASAQSIVVVGTDVFVAGYDNYKAVLWKNGAATILTSTAIATAYSMVVSGADVYIAGDQFSNFANGQINRYATYWKNGTPTNLTDGTTNTTALGIAVNGDDVYVAGVERGTDPFEQTAKYWKNNVSIDLQIPRNSYSEVFSIAVSGSMFTSQETTTLAEQFIGKTAFKHISRRAPVGLADKIFLFPK